MKLGVLFSGGKDSCLALYKAGMEKGNEIVCLITIESENSESYMFHTPNIHLAGMAAEAMDLPIIKSQTKGEKEAELFDLHNAIKKAIGKFGIKGIVTGAIASNYQRERIEKICNLLNIACINPLWGMNQIKVLKELVKNNFKVIIIGVYAYPMEEEFLGMEINKEIIEKMKELQKRYGINPAGEGGEIETFVIDAPMFKKQIKITKAEKDYSNNEGIFRIIDAELIKK